MLALPVFTLSPAKNKNTRSKSARMFLFYTIYISNLEIHSSASQFLIPSIFALPALTLSIGKKERTVARAYCPFPFFTKTISNLEIHPQGGQFLIPSIFALPVFTLSPAKTKKDCNNAVRFCFFHLLSVI